MSTIRTSKSSPATIARSPIQGRQPQHAAGSVREARRHEDQQEIGMALPQGRAGEDRRKVHSWPEARQTRKGHRDGEQHRDLGARRERRQEDRLQRVGQPAERRERAVPIIIGMGGSSLDSALVKAEGVATGVYDHNAMANEKSRSGKFTNIYGTSSGAGSQAAWAWGISRVIDVLVDEKAAGRNNIIDPRASASPVAPGTARPRSPSAPGTSASRWGFRRSPAPAACRRSGS